MRGFRDFFILLLFGLIQIGPYALPSGWAAERPYNGIDLLKIYDDVVPYILPNAQTYPEFLEQERLSLTSVGFRKWRWGNSHCEECALAILPTNMRIETFEVYEFIQALENQKIEILRLYPQASGQEYNLLAHMAIGILGRESEFFRSPRYKLKELAPGFIGAIKTINAYAEYYTRMTRNSWNWDVLTEEERAKAEKDRPRLTENSRGPTQIKVLPERIVKHFGVSIESLHRPEHAAVATMGYLLEALAELKRRVIKDGLTFVNDSNYADYLPYIYFGSRWRLMIDHEIPGSKPDATPSENIYIQDMKRYMQWVEIYESTPGLLLVRP